MMLNERPCVCVDLTVMTVSHCSCNTGGGEELLGLYSLCKFVVNTLKHGTVQDVPLQTINTYGSVLLLVI